MHINGVLFHVFNRLIQVNVLNASDKRADYF